MANHERWQIGSTSGHDDKRKRAGRFYLPESVMFSGPWVKHDAGTSCRGIPASELD